MTLHETLFPSILERQNVCERHPTTPIKPKAMAKAKTKANAKATAMVTFRCDNHLADV